MGPYQLTGELFLYGIALSDARVEAASLRRASDAARERAAFLEDALYDARETIASRAVEDALMERERERGTRAASEEEEGGDSDADADARRRLTRVVAGRTLAAATRGVSEVGGVVGEEEARRRRRRRGEGDAGRAGAAAAAAARGESPLAAISRARADATRRRRESERSPKTRSRERSRER